MHLYFSFNQKFQKIKKKIIGFIHKSQQFTHSAQIHIQNETMQTNVIASNCFFFKFIFIFFFWKFVMRSFVVVGFAWLRYKWENRMTQANNEIHFQSFFAIWMVGFCELKVVNLNTQSQTLQFWLKQFSKHAE